MTITYLDFIWIKIFNIDHTIEKVVHTIFISFSWNLLLIFKLCNFLISFNLLPVALYGKKCFLVNILSGSSKY